MQSKARFISRKQTSGVIPPFLIINVLFLVHSMGLSLKTLNPKLAITITRVNVWKELLVFEVGEKKKRTLYIHVPLLVISY